MVNITDVKQILQFAIDAEIKVFLDGGWGVDALLGYQSRAHNDIDIFVEKNDYQNFIEIMKANGFYEIKMEYTTLNHTVWEDLKSVEDYYLLRFGVESAMKATDQILNSNSSTSVIKELLVTPI